MRPRGDGYVPTILKNSISYPTIGKLKSISKLAIVSFNNFSKSLFAFKKYLKVCPNSQAYGSLINFNFFNCQIVLGVRQICEFSMQ